jgi:N6-L-threonylcarbamoyladenine synthase
MRVLAIETSCDETGIAVVEGRKMETGFKFTVLGNALLSQAALHAEYGGVYPTLAKREHQKNLPILLEQLAEQFRPPSPKATDGHSKEMFVEIDAIAVTEGPGLEPALWTGITFAQELAKQWQKPLFGVNHMEGHLISSLATARKQHTNKLENVGMFTLENTRFPILGLLVSGGHTLYAESSDWFEYKILGETLDDAVGECFDKVARMLGLPYPGGPHVSALAARARTDADLTRKYADKFKLPRPMIKSNTCDTSFSGLKTAALYALRDMGGIQSLSEDQVAAFAREFEDAVTEVFVAKTRRALRDSNARTFVIGGGVAANAHMRKMLVEMIKNEFPEVEIRLPNLSITGDNAIMIAEAALMHLMLEDWQKENPPGEIRAGGNLSLINL